MEEKCSLRAGMGAAENQAPGCAGEKIANEFFLSCNFVFLTSCRRLSYQVLSEFFLDSDMFSQCRPILQLL